MSDKAAKTEPPLARIIASPNDNEMHESARELRWAAKSVSAALNTDPEWAAVQATLRQMASENAVNAILDRQQAAMAGILNRLAPGDWQEWKLRDRPSTTEMEEAEADLRSQLPEIARRLPEVETAAEEIANDPEKRQIIERWYAWAWLATASAQHHLLIRRHLRTGELAFHYCFVPGGQLLTKARLIRAAGLRWPVVEEDFSFAKDCFALDQCQARLYTAIARHVVLVMATLAICAIATALLRDRTDTQAPPPVRPDQPPPPEPGMIPLTIPEIKRLLAALTTRPLPRRLVIHWDAWTRRHQARSRWFHKRARLARQPEFAQVKL